MTMQSGAIASRFRAVSTSVSPFETLEPEAETLTVSADSLFSANSKEIRVRVEFSKNRFTIVEPRSVGTYSLGGNTITTNGTGILVDGGTVTAHLNDLSGNTTGLFNGRPPKDPQNWASPKANTPPSEATSQ